MLEIRRVPAFETWLTGLRDRRGRAKSAARIDRLAPGHKGDAAPVGHGVSELRVHFGPGYRVYFPYLFVARMIGGIAIARVTKVRARQAATV